MYTPFDCIREAQNNLGGLPMYLYDFNVHVRHCTDNSLICLGFQLEKTVDNAAIESCIKEL